jgi:hypothetical protein
MSIVALPSLPTYGSQAAHLAASRGPSDVFMSDHVDMPGVDILSWGGGGLHRSSDP